MTTTLKGLHFDPAVNTRREVEVALTATGPAAAFDDRPRAPSV